jgi:hypothetical protein
MKNPFVIGEKEHWQKGYGTEVTRLREFNIDGTAKSLGCQLKVDAL